MSKLAHSCEVTMAAIDRAANDGRPTEPSTFGHLSTCKVHVYEACTCGAASTRTESEVRAKKGKTFPNDYWIVTSHTFKKHASTEDAYAERTRLQSLYPGRVFSVVHCKRRIEKNEQACEVIARQRLEIEVLKSVLRSIQWSAETDLPEGGYGAACPCCGWWKPDGHEPDCEIAKALGLTRGGLGNGSQNETQIVRSAITNESKGQHPEERTEMGARIDAIIDCDHRANIPHPQEPGKRIVGWVVSEHVAGLSDGLFAVATITDAFVAMKAALVDAKKMIGNLPVKHPQQIESRVHTFEIIAAALSLASGKGA